MRACSALVPVVPAPSSGAIDSTPARPATATRTARIHQPPDAKEQNLDVEPGKLYALDGPPPGPRRADGEPIVISNCYVQYEDRQRVSAEVEENRDHRQPALQRGRWPL